MNGFRSVIVPVVGGNADEREVFVRLSVVPMATAVGRVTKTAQRNNGLYQQKGATVV